MSADEFDRVAADDGMETREKGERPRWLHKWLSASLNDGIRYCSLCGYAEGSLPDCPMSVERSIPNQPPTVTGQSPREESLMVSVEAVEKAARALEDEFHIDGAEDFLPAEDIVRPILLAALPVIERDLREQVASELEEIGEMKYPTTIDRLAARVREGGRA